MYLQDQYDDDHSPIFFYYLGFDLKKVIMNKNIQELQKKNTVWRIFERTYDFNSSGANNTSCITVCIAI